MADYHPELLILIEKVRRRWDKPLIVSSGARCKAHSIAEGSSGDSTHCIDRSTGHIKCCAVDFNYFGSTQERQDFIDMVLQMYSAGEIPELGGLGTGYSNGCVHLDVYHDPDGHLRRW